jgi:hypothetical protein
MPDQLQSQAYRALSDREVTQSLNSNGENSMVGTSCNLNLENQLG